MPVLLEQYLQEPWLHTCHQMRNLLPSFLFLSAAFQAFKAHLSGASAVSSLAQSTTHTVEKELHSYFKKKKVI